LHNISLTGNAILSQQIILGVDTGGTFTDFVLLSNESGQSRLQIHKVPSTPEAPELAILEGIRQLKIEQKVKKGEIDIVHGSTVATNALLEGKGARTVFVTNYGFADMLTLGRQTRPKLYALDFPPQSPPVPAELCLETGGRIAADGSTVQDLSDSDLHQLLQNLVQLQPQAVAVNLLFSYLDDRFERAIAQVIEQLDAGIEVSCSSVVLPEYKEYERGIATWLNASLGPIVSGYISRLQAQLANSPLQIMQSSGETIAAAAAANSAVNLLLSGPAGGLAAIRFLGDGVDQQRLMSFDMGGTSTDVALLDGAIKISNEGEIARYPVAVPMVDMHTIGAGGGSIAYVDDGGMLQVGPKSAGANPGPACYGKGGLEATVTDANLLLGRLQSGLSLAGALQLKPAAAATAMQKLADEMDLSLEQTALGIIAVANEHMANALRLISVQRGYDVGEFVLASFGGAGGLHVCAIADLMEMTSAMVPVYGGVLSALGMVVANPGRQFSKTVNLLLDEVSEADIEAILQAIGDNGQCQLLASTAPAARLQRHASADMRYRGQSYTLNVPWENKTQVLADFHNRHSQRFGYSLDTEVELVNLRVNLAVVKDPPKLAGHVFDPACNNIAYAEVYGYDTAVSIRQRQGLEIDQEVPGPAIITEVSATTFVDEGWLGRLDSMGNLLLHKPRSAGPGE